jgi:MSHA biogenesis protein MshN
MGEGQIDKQPKSGGLPREQAEAEYRKGMQAAGVGDNVTAILALRRALDIDPKHIKARQALLSVLASSRQWDEVKQVAQSGLALDPARTGWASILARLQHEQGDTEGAVKTLESHAAHAVGDADFQGLFAFLLQKRQRYADAAQHYQAALALRPGEGRWWYGLGLALEGAGRIDEAKAAFGKARDAGNLPTDMLGIVEQKLR